MVLFLDGHVFHVVSVNPPPPKKKVIPKKNMELDAKEKTALPLPALALRLLTTIDGIEKGPVHKLNTQRAGQHVIRGIEPDPQFGTLLGTFDIDETILGRLIHEFSQDPTRRSRALKVLSNIKMSNLMATTVLHKFILSSSIDDAKMFARRFPYMEFESAYWRDTLDVDSDFATLAMWSVLVSRPPFYNQRNRKAGSPFFVPLLRQAVRSMRPDYLDTSYLSSSSKSQPAILRTLWTRHVIEELSTAHTIQDLIDFESDSFRDDDETIVAHYEYQQASIRQHPDTPPQLNEPYRTAFPDQPTFMGVDAKEISNDTIRYWLSTGMFDRTLFRAQKFQDGTVHTFYELANLYLKESIKYCHQSSQNYAPFLLVASVFFDKNWYVEQPEIVAACRTVVMSNLPAQLLPAWFALLHHTLSGPGGAEVYEHCLLNMLECAKSTGNVAVASMCLSGLRYLLGNSCLYRDVSQSDELIYTLRQSEQFQALIPSLLTRNLFIALVPGFIPFETAFCWAAFHGEPHLLYSLIRHMCDYYPNGCHHHIVSKFDAILESLAMGVAIRFGREEDDLGELRDYEAPGHKELEEFQHDLINSDRSIDKAFALTLLTSSRAFNDLMGGVDIPDINLGIRGDISHENYQACLQLLYVMGFEFGKPYRSIFDVVGDINFMYAYDVDMTAADVFVDGAFGFRDIDTWFTQRYATSSLTRSRSSSSSKPSASKPRSPTKSPTKKPKKAATTTSHVLHDDDDDSAVSWSLERKREEKREGKRRKLTEKERQNINVLLHQLRLL